MDEQERIHNKGLEQIANRLLNKYDIVVRNALYNTPDYNGEIDILALRGSRINLYELKTTNTYSARRHASEQLRRAKMAFPNANVRCIYIALFGNGKKVRRFY